MIPLEKYADLLALMADTAGDEARECAIAAEHGGDAETWKASKAGWTAKMSEPSDMGKTALAFMPLRQAAQARAGGGAEPCTLEQYARLHAEMAYRKDPLENPSHDMRVLAEHGVAQPQWLQCEGCWTPRVGADTILGQPNPQFDPAQAQRFRALMQQESDRIHGIVR